LVGSSKPSLGRASPRVADRGPTQPVRPSRRKRLGARLDMWRRMYLPMPHEVVDRYLGEGEQTIHTNHPSFRAFLMTNGVQVLILLFATALFLAVFSNGSMIASAAIGLVVLCVGAVLFGKRLREAYTSYVITNVRIMRLSGVLSRNVHSVPLGRITDLTIEQGLVGRL